MGDPEMLKGEFQDILAEAIAAVSDAGASRGNSSIGEEINALYRAARAAGNFDSNQRATRRLGR